MADELVVSQNEKAEIAPANPSEFFTGASVGRIWTSLPMDGSRTSKIKLINSIENVKANLRDIPGQVIEVTNIVCHSVVFQTDNGEEIEGVRTVLIDSNGDCYATVSDGIRSSLARIFAVVGMPPWEPPVKMAAREVKTRKGFRVMKLELVE